MLLNARALSSYHPAPSSAAAAATAAASASNGAPYTACRGSCGGLGLAAGVAPDFFTSADSIGLTMELRAGAGGGFQPFELPEEEIAPTGTEVWLCAC